MSQTILLTGANGQVSRMIRPLLLERYGKIICSARRPMDDLVEGESFRLANLDNPDELRAACKGVDGIIHMGGQSVEASWEIMRESNIDGMYNLFEAAREEGVKRVIFASSNHAVGMYPRTRKVGSETLARPDSRYGLSKIFGEALGAMYADKHGMRVLSIRIGNVGPVPLDMRRLSMWLHQEDLVQLCAIGLENPDLHHEVVYGLSDCIRSFWDNDAAYKLGYRPKHKAEDHLQAAIEGQKSAGADPIADAFVGGGFAAEDFDGDLERTLWS